MKTKLLIILTLLAIALQIYGINPRRYVTQDGSGLRDGSSWENAAGAEELQDILDTIEDADIWIAKGIYKPTKLRLEPESERDKVFSPNFNLIYGGFAGNETDLSQRDIKNNETIFSGDIGIEGDSSDNCYHVIKDIIILDGITICDGNANGLSVENDNYNGGGLNIWCNSSIIRNCIFRDNYASQQGGAVFMDVWGYDVIFENCLFYNNSSKYGSGGAIYSSYTETIISGCTFVKNTTENGSCVSMPYRSDDKIWINNNIFWNNTGGDLGAYNVIYSISHNAIEGGYEGFCNINLSSNNTGDVNSPYFTDPDNGDYSLLPQSPLFDKGVYWNTQCGTDITGQLRPQGLGWDIGAYEYNSGPLTAAPPSVSTLSSAFTTVSTARVHGNATSDGGSQMITKGVYYGTTAGFDPLTQGTLIKYNQLYSEGEFYIDITNLTPNTKYFYKIFCENRIGSDTGDEMSFTTRSGVNPDANGILYVKPDGTGDGSSWANALHGNDLQLGIDNTSVKEIWLAKGKYVPTSFPNGGTIDRQKHFSLKQNVVLYGGFSGTETTLEQRDLKLNKTVLSGDIGAEGEYIDNTYHVFYHTNRPEIDSTSVIDGITISDGYSASIARANSDKGGGMYNGFCSPTIRNCVFENNKTIYGGAIYNLAAFPNFKNCALINNTAIKTGGGLFFRDEYDYKESSVAYQRTIKMFHCTIAGNTAPQSSQIAFAHETWSDDSYIEIYNSVIWGAEPEMEWYDIDNYHQMEVITSPMQYSIITFCGLSSFETGDGNFIISRNNTGDINSPYFTDPENSDYALQELSACRDMAYYLYKTDEDVLGTSRPQGAAYDNGAYEYITSEPIGIAPTVETSFADSITVSSSLCRSNITSDGGADVMECGVKVSGENGFNPEIEGFLYSELGNFPEGVYAVRTCGLWQDSTYYYRSYARNRMGYCYGDQDSFKTIPAVPDINGIIYVKTDGTGNGSSWTNALNGNDLQAGILADSVKQVWVAEGTYYPTSWPSSAYYPESFNYQYREIDKHFTLKSGVELIGGFEGFESDVSERDHISHETVLSGNIGDLSKNSDNCTNIFIIWRIDDIPIIDSTAVIDGFIIRDGYAFDAVWSCGAGMQIIQSNPTIKNCKFINNSSERDGGALLIYNSSQFYDDSLNMKIINCEFLNNSIFGVGNGGAIFTYGAICKVELINCKFLNNTSENTSGGICSGSGLLIKNCHFEGNSGRGSGALHIFDYSLFGTKVINSTFVNNKANSLAGGITTGSGSSPTTIINTVLFNNGLDITDMTMGYNTNINNCAYTVAPDFDYTGSNNIILSPNNSGDPNSPYFSDPDKGNWMIQEYSPLRNAGIWSADVPLYDLVGFQRDEFPDIGCYEYDPTGIEDDETTLPLTTELYQNYPNPFNPVTNIKFDLNKTGKVELSIYNIAGQLVRKIIDKEMPAGYHNVRFEADDLNSGMYFYTLKTADKKLTRKMLMVK